MDSQPEKWEGLQPVHGSNRTHGLAMHKDMDADAVRDGAVVPAQPIEHLVALLQNEKAMMRRLRQDSDEMKEELLRLESACKEEDKALAKTMGELQHSDAQRRHLLEQLETSQNQLVELRSEYDMLQRESFVLQHEQNKYSSEAQFLQVLLEEYQRDSQAKSLKLSASADKEAFCNKEMQRWVSAIKETNGQPFTNVKGLYRKALNEPIDIDDIRAATSGKLATLGGADPKEAFIHHMVKTNIFTPRDDGRYELQFDCQHKAVKKVFDLQNQ
eukprot:s696_g18.t1